MRVGVPRWNGESVVTIGTWTAAFPLSFRRVYNFEMRKLVLVLLFVSIGCSSNAVVAPGGTPPVDVQVGGIELQATPFGERPPTAIAPSSERGFGTATQRSQMRVSIMNVSEHDVTLDRIDLSSSGGRARIQQTNHPLKRRIDAGDTIEVNVPVDVSLGGGALGDYTAVARVRMRVVLLSGEVWPYEFEVPVYERR